MRQKIRRTLVFLALFLFPVTLNFFSPYVSIDGAFQGIVSGSVVVFGLLFLSGLVFGRGWCGWLCPVAGVSEMGMLINDRPVPVRRLRILRYAIFGVWFAVLTGGFVTAGGIRQVNPLHLTERVISVDEPLKFITYYLVLLLFFGLTVWIGRRGACHSICWMSPFLTAGAQAGKWLGIPQLRIQSQPSGCRECKACARKCPMSIAVPERVKTGQIASVDCILCGQCVDACPHKVLRFGMGRG